MTRFVALFIASMLVAAIPATSLAGEEYEEILFRVTLEGPVDPSHAFSIRRSCREEPCVTQDIIELCGPPSESTNVPTCSARTYELTSEIRAGLTIDYALLRTTPTSDVPEEHLNGSIVVQEGRQVISLGYVYPDGSTRQPGASPVLPDTALPWFSDQ